MMTHYVKLSGLMMGHVSISVLMWTIKNVLIHAGTATISMTRGVPLATLAAKTLILWDNAFLELFSGSLWPHFFSA